MSSDDETQWDETVASVHQKGNFIDRRVSSGGSRGSSSGSSIAGNRAPAQSVEHKRSRLIQIFLFFRLSFFKAYYHSKRKKRNKNKSFKDDGLEIDENELLSGDEEEYDRKKQTRDFGGDLSFSDATGSESESDDDDVSATVESQQLACATIGRAIKKRKSNKKEEKEDDGYDLDKIISSDLPGMSNYVIISNQN